MANLQLRRTRLAQTLRGHAGMRTAKSTTRTTRAITTRTGHAGVRRTAHTTGASTTRKAQTARGHTGVRRMHPNHVAHPAVRRRSVRRVPVAHHTTALRARHVSEPKNVKRPVRTQGAKHRHAAHPQLAVKHPGRPVHHVRRGAAHVAPRRHVAHPAHHRRRTA